MNTLVTHGTAVMPEAAPVLRRKRKSLIQRIRALLLPRYLRRIGVEFTGKQWLHRELPAVTRDALSRIVLGDGCCFGYGVKLCATGGGVLSVGANTYLNTEGGVIHAERKIAIGAHCMISKGVVINDNSHHAMSPASPAKKAPIVIGRNVWINPGVRIGPGVTIGDHAVIGAGAVVTRDIPARSFAAGVPARVVSTFECADDWVRR